MNRPHARRIRCHADAGANAEIARGGRAGARFRAWSRPGRGIYSPRRGPAAPASEDNQRILQRLLRKPEFTTQLSDAHWRVMSAQTHCRNDAVAITLQILDYRHRKLVTVGYLVEADQILSLLVADLTDLQGPQPSAEEGREAVYMAERDPQVGAVLEGLSYRITSGAFFYEFGTQPENNDPDFPTCATGRCIDLLFGGSPPDGAYINHSVVVEMDACRVLGIKPRP